MFIKIGLVVLLGSISVMLSGQDTTTFFPWVQDGQLCQINVNGTIRTDNKSSISYPTTPVTEELLAYESQGLSGFKDKEGTIIINAGYEKVGHFREGFAWVKLDHKRFYYINQAEEPLINFTFDRCFDFQGGLARVFDKSKKAGHNGFGYLNAKGEITIPLQYKKAYDFVNGHALVQEQNGNWWLINSEGQKVQGPCQGLKAKKNSFSL